MTTLSTIVTLSRSKLTGYVEDFFFTGSAVHLRTGSSTCSKVIQLLSQNLRDLCHSKLSSKISETCVIQSFLSHQKLPCVRMNAFGIQIPSNSSMIIWNHLNMSADLCRFLNGKYITLHVLMWFTSWKKSSAQQLAKACNADLGGIPKVENLGRGQLKSWQNGSEVLKIEWGKPSITVGLIFTVSICTTKTYFGLKC